ncbi:ABC transporter permease [Cellulomonas humilata]|uniref:ABC-2 type transport system permease protein n=1 Tax=Cellulomonas humilata TaxID=144055 RepID=A0ABU0EHS5_9CELL|nr:ABC transporter permease [Cellulomonas humilata]MDQ0374633.1 ABC-2 type transport system permease protein [Cellulomonas humilata]
MSPAWTVELLKVRKSPVTRTAFGAMAAIAAFFSVGAALLAARGTAEGSLAGAKVAAMVDGVGWSAVGGAFGQIVSVLWLLGTGVVAAWTCGREYSDRTLGQLLALPTPSSRIATAKLGSVMLASSVAAVAGALLALVSGVVAGMGPPAVGDLQTMGAGVLAGVAGAWLALPFAWVGTVGRGYLPAVGALLGIVMVSQVVVLLGGGSWFPWAVPSLLVGAGGAEAAADVSALGVVLVVGVGAAAWASTVTTWSRLQLV